MNALSRAAGAIRRIAGHARRSFRDPRPAARAWLAGAHWSFPCWPAGFGGAAVFAAACLLIGALGGASYLGFRWNAASTVALPAARDLLIMIRGAEDQARHARRLGQDDPVTGRARSLSAEIAGLRRVRSSLGAMRATATGTGSPAAPAAERLTALVDVQIALAQRLAGIREAKPSGFTMLGMRIQSAGSAGGKSLALAAAKAQTDKNAERLAGSLNDVRDRQQRLVRRLEWEAASGARVFLAALVAGNFLAFAVIGWAVRSFVRHQSRGNAAVAALARVEGVLDAATEAMFAIDLEGRATFCNRTCVRLLGYGKASQLLGRNMHAAVFTAEGEEGGADPILAAMREGKGLHMAEGTARRADGTRFLVRYASSLMYEHDRVVGASVTLADISIPEAARAAQQRKHEALERQVRELSQHSKEMAVFGQLTELLQACTSEDELCKIVTVFAKDLFPTKAGSLFLMEPESLSLVPRSSWGESPPAGPAAFHSQECWAIRRGRPHYQEQPQGDLFCTHVGLPLPPFTVCLPLAGQGGTLGLLHFRGTAAATGMSEERRLVAVALAHQVALGLSNLKLKDILREDAIRDPVTGLYNRRFMKESIDHEILRARRIGSSVGLIVFDLDHFKEVNDTLGHAAGDALLQRLADSAKSRFRAQDVFCRQGGDEFLVILPDTSQHDTLQLAEELRNRAGQFIRSQYPALADTLTLSVGVAMFPQDASTPDGLREAADQALYRAKTLGRNQVVASLVAPVTA